MSGGTAFPVGKEVEVTKSLYVCQICITDFKF